MFLGTFLEPFFVRGRTVAASRVGVERPERRGGGRRGVRARDVRTVPGAPHRPRRRALRLVRARRLLRRQRLLRGARPRLRLDQRGGRLSRLLLRVAHLGAKLLELLRLFLDERLGPFDELPLLLRFFLRASRRERSNLAPQLLDRPLVRAHERLRPRRVFHRDVSSPSRRLELVTRGGRVDRRLRRVRPRRLRLRRRRRRLPRHPTRRRRRRFHSRARAPALPLRLRQTLREASHRVLLLLELAVRAIASRLEPGDDAGVAPGSSG